MLRWLRPTRATWLLLPLPLAAWLALAALGWTLVAVTGLVAWCVVLSALLAAVRAVAPRVR